MKRLPGLFILILVLFVVSCKESTVVSEPEPEAEYFAPEPVYRWGINIDSLDIVDGVIGRNELLSTILYRYGVSSQTIFYLEKASQETWSVRKMQSGKPYHILRDRDSIATARLFCL